MDNKILKYLIATCSLFLSVYSSDFMTQKIDLSDYKKELENYSINEQPIDDMLSLLAPKLKFRYSIEYNCNISETFVSTRELLGENLKEILQNIETKTSWKYVIDGDVINFIYGGLENSEQWPTNKEYESIHIYAEGKNLSTSLSKYIHNLADKNRYESFMTDRLEEVIILDKDGNERIEVFLNKGNLRKALNKLICSEVYTDKDVNLSWRVFKCKKSDNQLVADLELISYDRRNLTLKPLKWFSPPEKKHKHTTDSSTNKSKNERDRVILKDHFFDKKIYSYFDDFYKESNETYEITYLDILRIISLKGGYFIIIESENEDNILNEKVEKNIIEDTFTFFLNELAKKSLNIEEENKIISIIEDKVIQRKSSKLNINMDKLILSSGKPFDISLMKSLTEYLKIDPTINLDRPIVNPKKHTIRNFSIREALKIIITLDENVSCEDGFLLLINYDKSEDKYSFNLL